MNLQEKEKKGTNQRNSNNYTTTLQKHKKAPYNLYEHLLQEYFFSILSPLILQQTKKPDNQ